MRRRSVADAPLAARFGEGRHLHVCSSGERRAEIAHVAIASGNSVNACARRLDHQCRRRGPRRRTTRPRPSTSSRWQFRPHLWQSSTGALICNSSSPTRSRRHSFRRLPAGRASTRRSKSGQSFALPLTTTRAGEPLHWPRSSARICSRRDGVCALLSPLAGCTSQMATDHGRQPAHQQSRASRDRCTRLQRRRCSSPTRTRARALPRTSSRQARRRTARANVRVVDFSKVAGRRRQRRQERLCQSPIRRKRRSTVPLSRRPMTMTTTPTSARVTATMSLRLICRAALQCARGAVSSPLPWSARSVPSTDVGLGARIWCAAWPICRARTCSAPAADPYCRASTCSTGRMDRKLYSLRTAGGQEHHHEFVADDGGTFAGGVACRNNTLKITVQSIARFVDRKIGRCCRSHGRRWPRCQSCVPTDVSATAAAAAAAADGD
jgi:hypothetical protein